MSHKEAIYCLKAESKLYPEVCSKCELNGKAGCDHCFDEATDIAIKAIEKQIELKKYVDDCKSCGRGSAVEFLEKYLVD